MAYDCYCILCRRKVSPEDYIYFPHANPEIPLEYRWAHHSCYERCLEAERR